jgi:hypothetical protein
MLIEISFLKRKITLEKFEKDCETAVRKPNIVLASWSRVQWEMWKQITEMWHFRPYDSICFKIH